MCLVFVWWRCWLCLFGEVLYCSVVFLGWVVVRCGVVVGAVAVGSVLGVVFC